MRFLLVPLALAALAIGGAAPVAAAGLSGMGKAIFGNSTFTFRKANLTSVPVSAISVGGLKVELQHTRLGDVQKVFGGTIQQSSGGDESRADWLCYTTDGSNGPKANVWFISNALGGHEFVMMVAAELAGARPAGDCQPAPARLGLPQFGIPGLGAQTAELKSKLGPGTGRSGAVSYRADEPGKDALGTALNVQYIGYLTKAGTVSAVAVGEGSAQIMN